MDQRPFNLADIYEVVADACPDRMAVVAGQARLTYRQLDERANRLGHHLQKAGIGPGDFVGVYAWNRAEWIEAMLACFKIRAVPINVNYRYVTDELRYLFDNADLVALIYEQEFGPLVAAVLSGCPKLRHLIVIDDGHDADVLPTATRYESALAGSSPGRYFPSRSSDDLYVIYTGGTTGMPKGVMWRSEDIFKGAMGGGNFGGDPVSSPEELTSRAGNPGMVHCITAPMMHGGGQWVAWITFAMCGTVVLWTGHRYDADEIWRLVERERAQSIMVVGDAMARPLAEALATHPGRYDTSSVVVVGSGGSILSKAVKEQLRAQLSGAVVMDSFGASETGANGSVQDFDGPAAGPRFRMAEHTTVLDDQLRPVEPGSGRTGRLARRGHIPIGYYKDEAKTGATFVADNDGVRWVIPGDWASVEADGTINLLGRGSVSIQTGGEKVFPEEVEAALKSHAEVFDAVVVGVPDGRWVERVAAIVTPRPGRRPTLAELAGHCRTQLAGYKVPRQLSLVDEIVRTPAGKPDYRWAKAQALAHVDGPIL